MAHGHFIWNELVTHDVEKAKRFYAAALGWTYESVPAANGATYWLIKLGQQRIGGMFPLEGPEYANVPEGWLPYIDVDDVDERVKKAQAGGAKLMRPIFDIPNIGRVALLTEPGGAGIAWMTPKGM